MADDTPTGETAAPVAPSNEPGNTSTPQGQSSADVEQAKREAEQARIRANQLENELRAEREKQAAAERKQLEEKEEYKTLFERTQSELEAMKSEREASERRVALTAATNDLFKDYPDNVVELAKTAGLGLSDDSETAKASLKEKLDTFAKSMGVSAPTVAPNNPANPGPTTASPETDPWRIGRPQTLGIDDGTGAGLAGRTIDSASSKKFGEYVSALPSIKQMKRQAGVQTD